jgi:hypothetical protein
MKLPIGARMQSFGVLMPKITEISMFFSIYYSVLLIIRTMEIIAICFLVKDKFSS